MTPQQLAGDILSFLVKHAEDAFRMRALAEYLQVDVARAGFAIDGLVHDGLVVGCTILAPGRPADLEIKATLKALHGAPKTNYYSRNAGKTSEKGLEKASAVNAGRIAAREAKERERPDYRPATNELHCAWCGDWSDATENFPLDALKHSKPRRCFNCGKLGRRKRRKDAKRAPGEKRVHQVTAKQLTQRSRRMEIERDVDDWIEERLPATDRSGVLAV